MVNFYFGDGTYGNVQLLSNSDVSNIKSVSAQGWNYLRLLDQGLNSTSSPTFYDLTLSDKLKLSNSGFTIALQAPTLTASYSLLLPTADGTVCQVLKTDGAGNLGWVTTFAANQSLDTTSSPQFAYLGINQAAGTERLEVTGNIKSTGLLLSTGLKSTPNLNITTAGVYHPPGWPGYESLLGVVELRSLSTDAGHSCGILFSNMYSSRQHRVATTGTGNFVIRDDTAGADRLYIDTSGNTTVSGNFTSEASRVFLQAAGPDQANALFLRWQGGSGKSYIVSANGSGSGEIALGHYTGSTYYEQLAIGLTGGIRSYYTGGSGGAAIGQFYNTSLAAGNEVFLTIGIDKDNTGGNAWMLYHRDGSTLANSVGKLGIWGYQSAICWSGSGKVAIGSNAVPGTEMLEISGGCSAQYFSSISSTAGNGYRLYDENPTIRGQIVRVDQATEYFSDSQPEDLAIRVETAGTSIRLGVNGNPATCQIHASGLNLYNSKYISVPTSSAASSSLVMNFRNEYDFGAQILTDAYGNHGNSLRFTYRDYNTGGGVLSGDIMELIPQLGGQVLIRNNISTPPEDVSYSSYKGLIEIQNGTSSGGHECGLLLKSNYTGQTRKYRVVILGSDGSFRIRDEAPGQDVFIIEHSTGVNIVEMPNVYVNGPFKINNDGVEFTSPHTGLTYGRSNNINGTECVLLGVGLTAGGAELRFGNSSTNSYCAYGGTTWVAVSDQRYKKDITPLSWDSLDFIYRLHPCTFNMINGSNGDVKRIGFIAQEVKEAYDASNISPNEFELWKENSQGIQEIGQAALIPVLVKAIQQLTDRVIQLENLYGM